MALMLRPIASCARRFGSPAIARRCVIASVGMLCVAALAERHLHSHTYEMVARIACVGSLCFALAVHAIYQREQMRRIRERHAFAAREEPPLSPCQPRGQLDVASK